MPEQTPVTQLITSTQKVAANAAMWIAAAMVGAAPIAIQQINANRGPGSIEYLNPGDFQILGPNLAEPGSLVRLTVVDYEPTDVVWFWADTEGLAFDYLEYGSNSAQVAFAMPNGPAAVTCSIIRNGELYLTQKTVQPPEPLESPEPEFEPLSEIGEKVLKMARDADLSIQGAKDLADNLREAANEGTNPRSLVMRTAELNQALDLPDGVTKRIQVLLQTLAEEGSLQTMNQHLKVWRQMSNGFERYASE